MLLTCVLCPYDEKLEKDEQYEGHERKSGISRLPYERQNTLSVSAASYTHSAKHDSRFDELNYILLWVKWDQDRRMVVSSSASWLMHSLPLASHCINFN